MQEDLEQMKKVLAECGRLFADIEQALTEAGGQYAKQLLRAAIAAKAGSAQVRCALAELR